MTNYRIKIHSSSYKTHFTLEYRAFLFFWFQVTESDGYYPRIRYTKEYKTMTQAMQDFEKFKREDEKIKVSIVWTDKKT